MTFLSPVLAIGVTVMIGGVIFSALGLYPLKALYLYFVEPLTSLWSIEEIIVKAAPLVLIGVGLSICYTANVWNIGAEGQLTIGALFGAAIPIYFTGWQSPLVLVLMLALGAVGGALFAAIPALLKTRFNANEILTSLMLVYVAQYLLDWLVRGPWRDPQGYNFPQSVPFEGWQLLPTLGDGRVHIGALLASVVALILFVMMGRSLRGFEIRVIGSAPRGCIRRLCRKARHLVLIHPVMRLGRNGGLVRGRRPERAVAADYFTGLRLYRNYCRVPGPPEPGWCHLRRHPARDQLSPRRGGSSRVQHLRQERAGIPRDPALSHPRLRHADPLSDQVCFTQSETGVRAER